MLKHMTDWLKRDPVLSAAGVLAVLSCFLVPPDGAYPGYVDWHTLGVLFCLMTVMAGLQRLGLFRAIGQSLLRHVRSERGLAAILVFLCFFSSMLVTNDVALITFVPFALYLLHLAKMEDLLCQTVVLQTIAANLGSMLTPIGNPQNLYLYGRSGMPLLDFLLLTLPYVALSGVGLLAAVWKLFPAHPIQGELSMRKEKMSKRRITLYSTLFLLCLLTVAKMLSIWIVLLLLVIAVLFEDRKLFLRVDYTLLITFIAFFVFIGNMGRFPAFHDFVAKTVQGHELITAVVSSQAISNVPAALLLSGFTDQYRELILGTDIGGLGTLIASMASLISYKQVTLRYPERKGRYFRLFTLWNLLFLVLLLGEWFLLSRM